MSNEARLANRSQADTVINPFPGLRPFHIDESHLFFGREGQSDEVLLKLSKNRFVSVIGPSGSGKSSFIYCGVLPILYGGFLADSSPNWDVIVTRPGAGPIDNLAESLLQQDPEYLVAGEEDKKIKRTIITTLLRSSSIGLVEAVLQLKRSSDNNYLILVDQFEELFRFRDSAESSSLNETLAFINLLMEAIEHPDVPIYVAITMRSDFIGDCAQFPELTKKINDSHYLIPQMTREQKRRAIEGPVAVGGARITSRLTQQLLNDLGDNPDQLPILQHALMRTWGYWNRHEDKTNEPLDIIHYEAIGTMSEALSLHANEAYEELKEDEKDICEALFKSITEKRGDNFGIRRPTRLGEIASIANVAEERAIAVIERFRAPGRSLLTPAAHVPLYADSIIDISHESLMRIWTRLKNWVEDEEEAVQMYLRLSEAAGMYQVGKAGLWRPPDLQLALQWQAKHKPTLVWGQRYHPAYERTMIFLEYSRKEYETEQRIKELEQKKRLRNARIVTIIFAVAAIICMLFLLFAFYQKTEADRQADLATEQRKRAEQGEEQAKLNARIADQERKNAELSEEAALIARDSAKTNLNFALEQQGRAERQTELARKRELEANDARFRAEKNEELAKTRQQEALTAKAQADRLRMLAIGKAMAIKSTQLREEQKILKGLLSQQAYNFNTANDGDQYDNDIYDGLYYAIKDLKDPLVESLKGHNKGIRAITAADVGNNVYTAGTEGRIIRWSLQGGARVADTIVNTRPDHLIRAIDVTGDNKRLVVAGQFPQINGSSHVEIYDLGSKSAEKVKGFRGPIWNVIVAPDNKSFYALDNNGNSVKQSDFSTTKKIINSPSVRLNDIAITHDGNYLIGAGNNGRVYLYDIKNGYKASEIYNNGNKVLAIAVDSNNTVAIGDENGIVKAFRLFSNAELIRLIGHSSPINDITFSTDGRFIASASRDKTVRLWNRANLTAQPITLKDHPDWVWTIAFTPDDQQVLAGTQESVVRAWPTNIEVMADKICSKIDRNMTAKEWDTYVAEDINYEKTCEAYTGEE